MSIESTRKWRQKLRDTHGAALVYTGKSCKRCGGTQRYVSNGNCIVCVKGDLRKDRITNPSKYAEKQRAWRVENPEKAKAKGRAYYLKNRERLLAQMRAYIHPDPARKKALDYLRCKEWRKNNRERYLAIARANVATRKARIRGAGGDGVNVDEWAEICKAHEYCCAYCGCKFEKLTRDHVIPVSRGGPDSCTNVVPACHACNSSKKDRDKPMTPMHMEIFKSRTAEQYP
jgi:5-methylcytosine-specific restriction endonuclease McrA